MFGDDHWTVGPLAGGPVRRIRAPGSGAHPPRLPGIDPAQAGVVTVLDSATAADGRAFVLRRIVYLTPNRWDNYVAYEVVEVRIETGRVLRRTRFGDETRGPGVLPYAFDLRLS